ncbi:DNA ligase 3-like isoform X1 [Pocillopora damicornis]|uniref:DNA ligase 3-like isoform X1 n=1 Tax=Pocillopora damicornis TaxID=46731 RepID=UPI000F550A9A|nr:DNA ligase 3-like isoform X1 [Pocillopora damicornis]
MFGISRRSIQLVKENSTLYHRRIVLALNIMADGAEDKPFLVEYAAQGRAKCKTCKQQIEKSVTRIGKLVSNPFGEDGGMMKQWYHVPCIFDTLSRARATTKKIDSTDDLGGFENLKDDDQAKILSLIKDLAVKMSSPKKKAVQSTLPYGKPKPSTPSKVGPADGKKSSSSGSGSHSSSPLKGETDEHSKDNSFHEFRRICINLAEEPSYNNKSKILSEFFAKGSSGDGFTGDLTLWVKTLLPAVNKRVYNLQSKQLVKLYSQIFGCSQDDMITDLEQGDVSETLSTFFQSSSLLKPLKKSLISLLEVDAFLDKLKTLTKEDDQQRELTKMTRRCSANDLKFIIRLIKHDLRMNTGAKHVLDAIDPNAYEAFQASNNLTDVVQRCLQKKESNAGVLPGMSKKLSIKASLMTPVKPMLAEACKSFSQALKKCPKGMYAEIKYDGERVQVHKSGNEFQFFSRSLKPVLAHKVAPIKDHLPKACPHGNSLILDSEVLLVDNKTSKPLPFGTLGIHKKSAFKDASVCLFIFDCLQFNDENMMKKSMTERRKVLEQNVTVIPNKIMLSEMNFLKTEKELSKLMTRAIKEGLEGLVLKDINGIYEPGKRHWLKMKRDYLEEGAMADTADLVVLGAYYGTGNKGGLMSIFLMGVWDPATKQWCTVARCGNGHDDKTLERLNRELKMKKISKDPSKVPLWLNIHRTLVPDFVVEDPKKSPVWEITGAEFSKSTTHTADGISIRFPRVTRIRDDKDWQTANDLPHLKVLFKNSRASTNVADLVDNDDDDNADDDDDATDDDHDPPTKDKEMKNESPSKESNETEKITRKRKTLDYQENSSPGKRAKSACKYGSKCYQKSEDHLQKFSHPQNDNGDESSPSKNKTLKDIFQGLTIFLANDLEDSAKLRRYIIAYDGDVVDEFEKTTASHIVSNTKGGHTMDRPVKLISPSWIWKCIKKGHLVPENKFAL